jgi:hypothetical protein
MRASRRMSTVRSSMRIVITAPLPPLTCLTSLTLPTLTPAMRTGEFGLRLLTVSKAAWISKCDRNGIDFVNPR